MASSKVNSESLPAVKSLRSKFEQFAVDKDHQRLSPASSQGDLLSAHARDPRPRASSGTVTSTQAEDIQHLRPSSSSSDLKVSGKRPPPPPPPPRGSKPPIPSYSSPTLRPVPIPHGNSFSNGVQSSRSRGLNLGSSHRSSSVRLDSEVSAQTSVAELKNKFIPTSPSTHSPRQSISNLFPSIQTESSSPSPQPIAKPVIPPRPQKTLDVPTSTLPNSTNRLVHTVNTTSGSLLSEARETSSSSPFLDDGDSDDNSEQYDEKPNKFIPPPIPVRRFGSVSKSNAISIRNAGAQNSENSLSLDETEFSNTIPAMGSTPPTSLPPRPPPRHPISFTSPTDDSSASLPLPTITKLSVSPPPLPVRRSTVAQSEDISQNNIPPTLPGRSRLYDSPQSSAQDVSQVNERKSVGSGKLPPPPTRIIGLGDKLPPARRATSPSSDEESGEEDDAKFNIADTMPDSSTSSRRSPTLTFRDAYVEPKIPVHPHSGCVALSGAYIIVSHGHHMKIYDLAKSDAPIFNFDTKELGLKDAKVTSMEFRSCKNKVDRGFLLWVGTKEGHLFELDIRTANINAIKHVAHPHPITNIFRHGRCMVSLDEGGKILVFSPDASTDDVSLSLTVPRVARTTEKQDFVKIIDGKLWTAARSEHHGNSSNNLQKLPIIRVYDILNPSSTGRSLLPTEHVGPVTSATILPSQPDYVFVGHEEGFITIWALETEDGYPQCVEVIKVSVSDVLSLEGVNDRLWAGARNGMISSYDVTQKPWVVTNCWNAHPGLPVSKLMVNHYAIERNNKLCVASIGRDEQLRLWDGLLGLDWVDKELLKRETSFSTFRDISVLIVSWNCDSARPDALTVDSTNSSFLNNALSSVNSPDIIAFGFQEVIDLESRRMTAKNVLLGKKKPEDAGLSDKVTGAYKRWYDRLILAVRAAMPAVPYSVIHTESLVGLFTCIFVKQSERTLLHDVAVTTVKRGMGGRYGNKGGIVARLVIEDSSICIINCHLAAGQNAVRRRNADAAGLLEEKSVFAATEHPLAYVGGGDGSMVLDHEIVFFHGDMNYRIDHRRDPIIAAIRADDLSSLMSYDQLLREIKFNRGCRLRGFNEGPITFAPTYKYDSRSDEYDTSEKHRSPAWCDRILWRTRAQNRVRQLHYERYEVNVSDHRPISAAFLVTVKTLQRDAREKVHAKVEKMWVEEAARLLSGAKLFYVRQGII